MKPPSNESCEIPSPLRGERVRVRGARRNRSAAARHLARHLRRKSGEAEKRLWRILRGRRFNGFKFRRQYPFGRYFIDFFCAEARLAVELDGGVHGFPEQKQHDREKDAFLEAGGIRVLRFGNHQLRSNAMSLRFEIWRALMERTGQQEKLGGFKPVEEPAR
jgi:very-short-patch-repair endonuclease